MLVQELTIALNRISFKNLIQYLCEIGVYPGREKMRSLQGSCKILVTMQLLVRSCNEICSLQDLARKCFP